MDSELINNPPPLPKLTRQIGLDKVHLFTSLGLVDSTPKVALYSDSLDDKCWAILLYRDNSGTVIQDYRDGLTSQDIEDLLKITDGECLYESWRSCNIQDNN